MRLVVAGANVHFRDPATGVMFLYKVVEGGLSKLTDLLLLIKRRFDGNTWKAGPFAPPGGHARVLERLLAAGAGVDTDGGRSIPVAVNGDSNAVTSGSWKFSFDMG